MESGLPTSVENELTRRDFVRTLLLGTAVSMVVGRPWNGVLIASVQASPVVGGPGLLRLRTADFPPLLNDFGSIRLGFTTTGQSGPMPPMLLTRDGGQYNAVTAECTHQGCMLTAFPASRVTTCSCHGSRFSSDGEVVRGPATQPLDRYFVQEIEDGVLAIELPGFPSFDVTIESVESASAARVSVAFTALRNVQYEIRSAASAAGPWEVRSFSTTVDGLPNKTVFTGTGAAVKLYVDRIGGAAILAAAAKIRQV